MLKTTQNYVTKMESVILIQYVCCYLSKYFLVICKTNPQKHYCTEFCACFKLVHVYARAQLGGEMELKTVNLTNGNQQKSIQNHRLHLY